MSAARPLDHLVLPVANLDEAQRRYRALGFTLAPVGVHPFGTANCCVYLEDGTFLEPLAVADRETADAAIEAGNTFVAGDDNYRRLIGDQGFAALVLGTSDAKDDDRRFSDAGFAGGDVLDFSRDVIDKTGRTGTASFRLAFARDSLSAAPFFFTCQRVKTPKVNRTALQHHRNGVLGLRRIILTAAEPRAHLGFLETFCGVVGAEHGKSAVALNLPNAEIVVETPEAFRQRWDVDFSVPNGGAGLYPMAAVFSVPDIRPLASLFKADAITYLAHDNALIAPPATGQGAYFIFEASA